MSEMIITNLCYNPSQTLVSAMVQSENVQQTITRTALKTSIENKNYEFVADYDACLEDCLIALDQFRDYVLEIKKKTEEIEQE